MRPVVRDIRLFIPGVYGPEPKEPPAGSTHFAFSCLVMIGLENAEGEDRFDLFACSPSWLAENFTATEEETGRRLLPWVRTEPSGASFFAPTLLLMPTWSPDALVEEIDKICRRCEGPDWPTVASRLTRYLDWEYEYRYDEYVDLHAQQFQLPENWASTSYRRSAIDGEP